MSPVVNALSGWTGVVLALVAFAVAFTCRSTAVGVFAAVLSVPFCYFVNGYPIVGVLAWVALVGNFVAGCILRRRRDVAFAALTPFAAICGFSACWPFEGSGWRMGDESQAKAGLHDSHELR